MTSKDAAVPPRKPAASANPSGRWHEVHSRVIAEDAEPVAELFARYGHGGVAIEEEPYRGGEEPRMVSVKTYIPQNTTARRKIAQIQRGLRFLSLIHPIGPAEVKDILEDDWANAWKEHYTVQRIARRVVVQPSWREYTPAEDDVVVRLDPGMAFGTGLHPSTRLCLAALEERLRPGTRILDLGTGSGILAIAAAKLGAGHVDAIDISPIAVRVARENVDINGVQQLVTVAEGTVEDKGPLYDMIVANLTARVIVHLARLMVARLRPGGIVIGGGIIAEQLPDVEARLAELGARCIQVLEEEDWRAIVAFREGGATQEAH